MNNLNLLDNSQGTCILCKYMFASRMMYICEREIVSYVKHKAIEIKTSKISDLDTFSCFAINKGKAF